MTIYSDINVNDPEVRPLVYEAESVFQHIVNILSISKKERLFQPTLGIAFRSILFELMDDITSEAVQHTLYEELIEQDFRVLINFQATITEAIPEDNVYDITLAFGILGINDETFEFRGILEK